MVGVSQTGPKDDKQGSSHILILIVGPVSYMDKKIYRYGSPQYTKSKIKC